MNRTALAARLAYWAVVATAALATIARAEEAAPAVAVSPRPIAAAVAAPAAPAFGLAQGVFGLVVVVGLIFAAGWLMKRIGPRSRSSGVVRVVGGASVGPREKVVVIRFGTQTLLLGVAPGHVGLLGVAPSGDGDDPSGPLVVEPTAATSPMRFADRLRAARGAS